MKHVLGFSGGKDSEACYCWLADRFAKEDIVLTNLTAGDNEDPLTVDFIQRFSDTVHYVHVVRPIIADMWITAGMAEKHGYDPAAYLDFPTMATIKKRFPSRTAQFCTEKLKLVPMKRWIEVNLPDGNYERYSGVRRDESAKRKSRQLREWDDYFDCYLNNPLVDWTAQQCVDFIVQHGLEINPLYRLGFNRVGCAPCINSSKADITNWLEQRPAMIDKIRKWELQVGRTYFPPVVPGKVINWIDEVIDWAKTSRGGRQYNMLKMFEPTPSCSSKYGLCE